MHSPTSKTICTLCVAGMLVSASFAKTTHKKPAHQSASKSAHLSKTHARSSHSRSHVKKVASWRSKGQHNIDSERTREIQEALIREHYLSGEPDGSWDTRTQAAMKKFQADNGWQSKVLPDSRALIKLGLGPDHSAVINPDTAVMSPYLPVSERNTQAVVPTQSLLPTDRDQQ